MVKCRDCGRYNKVNKRCGVLKKALPPWWNPDEEVACTPFEERKPKEEKPKTEKEKAE